MRVRILLLIILTLVAVVTLGVGIGYGTFLFGLSFAFGAFVAGSAKMRDLFVNTARSFIFSCALAPPQVAAARAALLADTIDQEAYIVVGHWLEASVRVVVG